MIQLRLTPAMGKRLIGKGMVQHPAMQRALAEGSIAIIGGSTNGYVAEEVLASIGQSEGYNRIGFRRGLTTPPGVNAPEMDFPGDVVIRKGEWKKDENSIFKAAKSMGGGDVVLKGGNAFDALGQAAVQIGHNVGGTSIAAVSAVIGTRAKLIVPIGQEKRVFGNVHELALLTNDTDGDGPGLLPLPGEIFTELGAIKLLTGADATVIAAGGVYGAEGGVWLVITGSDDEVKTAKALIDSVAGEPPCEA